MKSIGCPCPKCGEINVNNVEENIQGRNVKWLSCSFCQKISDMNDWVKSFSEGGYTHEST